MTFASESQFHVNLPWVNAYLAEFPYSVLNALNVKALSIMRRPSPWLWNLREPSHSLRCKLYYGHNGREHSAMRGHLGITFTYLNFKLITGEFQRYEKCFWLRREHGDWWPCNKRTRIKKIQRRTWMKELKFLSYILHVIIILIFNYNLCKQYNRWPPPPMHSLQQFA